MARKLTTAERQAVARLEKALEGMPKTLGIFAEGQGVYIYDAPLSDFEVHTHTEHEHHLVASVNPNCSYDAGGW